ncbi:MAG TPA: hypothetical protein VFF94_02390 [Novosphingobium sp.]|nr:hypothetical protein [Novosphingobium sp.]
MASQPPYYRLEQQYPDLSRRGTHWEDYGIYSSFTRARAKAALLARPCRITECRIVWRSVPIR